MQKSELMGGQEEYTFGGFWLKYGLTITRIFHTYIYI